MIKKYKKVEVEDSRGNVTYHPVGLVIGDLVNGKLVFGWSLTHKLDKFKRTEANNLAYSRFNHGNYYISNLGQLSALKDQIPYSLHSTLNNLVIALLAKYKVSVK